MGAMEKSLYEYCGQNECAELLTEWDAEKNAPLTPHELSYASHRRVWWRCERGHSWCAQVASRTKERTGCPYCAGKQPIAGETDLASRFPTIAAQWDAARNGTLTPQSITAYSNRAVWWRCEKGHSYHATVAHRTKEGSDCPYCTGRKVLAGFNDLETLYPCLAAQWHPTRNGALTPQQVTRGSHRRVWWQCPLGHVWRAVVYSRTDERECGCPVCAGRTGE